jgi:hypothetical protein
MTAPAPGVGRGHVDLGIPVIGVTDLSRAAAFWAEALDLVDYDEWGSDTWRTLVHSDGSGRALGLQLSESPVEPHPRVHVDLFVESAQEQQAEVTRLIRLGATKVEWDSYPPAPDFTVLADPDGNVFCIVDLSHALSQ